MTKKQSKLNRDELLRELHSLCKAGQGENESDNPEEFLPHFLPIRSHYRILDPDTQVIIGDKGSGKTQMFKALTFEQGRQALVDIAGAEGRRVAGLQHASWAVGFSTSIRSNWFPPTPIIEKFAADQTPVALQTFWLGLLIRVLIKTGNLEEDRFTKSLTRSLLADRWDLDQLVSTWDSEQPSLFYELDQLDQRLVANDQYLFVTYDELDRVTTNWDHMKVMLQGLVQFWATNGRRWKRLRPKLFIRRDLFQRTAFFGPDMAKIVAHHTELLWEVKEFYGTLFKRILNSPGQLPKYLGEAKPKAKLRDGLGLVPTMESESDFEAAVERLFGKYMGADPRKGFTLNWIPNRLKDGHGRIYPRPLLRLIEEAVDIELREQRAKGSEQLIHHTALRGALDRVSELRVNELVEFEFRWLERVRKAFQERKLTVPAERREIRQALRIDWPDDVEVPYTDPDDVLDYLVELGIAQIRPDGRVDVGDLYLSGLFLKRKGGVARPEPANRKQA